MARGLSRHVLTVLDAPLQFLRKLHIWSYAWFLRRYRIRYTVAIFEKAHIQELRETPQAQWSVAIQRHNAEIKAIRAGKLDAAIVDRKSWQFPFLPASVQRMSMPLLKAVPYNLRRLSRTPVPRRAMNMIKGAMISQPWDIRAIDDVPVHDTDEQEDRIKIAKRTFQHPNMQDSFQTFIEMGLEDMLVLGTFVAEMATTLDPERPIKMWAVNVESIRIFPAWSEATSQDMPHYAQMTGLKGERGAILFYDDEMMYVKDNPSTDSPFGLGKMEVGFQSINDFLGVQGMSGRAGTDQVHKTFLWWEAPQNDAHIQIIRRHIQNDLEGQAKLSLIHGAKKPEVIEVTPVTQDDLLLQWQELLIRMIANAFDMSAMALGIEHDINRAVGEVLSDKDFRTAVVPMAKRLQDAFTRKILHNRLGWNDLEFVFLNLDDPDTQTKIDMFGRLYQMNAVTPNQVLVKLNMPKLDSPLADLTQFECMLLNIEAQAKIQDDMQNKAMQRSMQQQQLMPPPLPPDDSMPPDNGGGGGGGFGGPQGAPPFGGGPGGGKPGGGAAGVTAPKPLSLPKFPIRGSRYTAKELAGMPVNKITDALQSSGLRASDMLQSMDEQEPGILQTLSDEVKAFFQQALEEEKAKPPRRISQATLNKWTKELRQRVAKQKNRTDDLATFLYKTGRAAGRPGVAPKNTDAGKPGQPPKYGA